MEVKVKEYQMLSHLSFETKHYAKYSGIFECEGETLHGKKFIAESETKMKGYKTKLLFYLDEPNSKTFKSLVELVNYYNNEH